MLSARKQIAVVTILGVIFVFILWSNVFLRPSLKDIGEYHQKVLFRQQKVNTSQKVNHKEMVDESNVTSPDRTVWISTAVCWSSNSHFNNKQNFPYRLAAKLSAELLQMQMNINVTSIVQIIYERKDEGTPKLMKYANEIVEIGGHVTLMPTPNNMSCSMASQLQRMFAFTLPYVDPNDLVVTSDADTFIADPDIFKPLENKHYRVWLFQYSISKRSGSTFPMTFIAMTAREWQQILGVQSAEEMMQVYGWLLVGNTAWYTDQHIISHAILKSKLCSLPVINTLWKAVRLEPPKEPVDDSKTCFHGSNYRDCFKYRFFMKGGCKWWHFTPDTTPKQLYNRFTKIVKNRNSTAVCKPFSSYYTIGTE